MKEASNSLFFLSLLSKANLFKEDNDLENKEDEVNDDLYGQGFDKKFIDGMLQNKTSQRALNEYAIPNEGDTSTSQMTPAVKQIWGFLKDTIQMKILKI